jgi:hypothetical protein
MYYQTSFEREENISGMFRKAYVVKPFENKCSLQIYHLYFLRLEGLLFLTMKKKITININRGKFYKLSRREE